MLLPPRKRVARSGKHNKRPSQRTFRRRRPLGCTCLHCLQPWLGQACLVAGAAEAPVEATGAVNGLAAQGSADAAHGAAAGQLQPQGQPKRNRLAARNAPGLRSNVQVVLHRAAAQDFAAANPQAVQQVQPLMMQPQQERLTQLPLRAQTEQLAAADIAGQLGSVLVPLQQQQQLQPSCHVCMSTQHTHMKCPATFALDYSTAPPSAPGRKRRKAVAVAGAVLSRLSRPQQELLHEVERLAGHVQGFTSGLTPEMLLAVSVLLEATAGEAVAARLQAAHQQGTAA